MPFTITLSTTHLGKDYYFFIETRQDMLENHNNENTIFNSSFYMMYTFRWGQYSIN